MSRVRVKRKGNPTRPWCVYAGHVVLANFPTWGEAIRCARGYATALNHTESREND